MTHANCRLSLDIARNVVLKALWLVHSMSWQSWSKYEREQLEKIAAHAVKASSLEDTRNTLAINTQAIVDDEQSAPAPILKNIIQKEATKTFNKLQKNSKGGKIPHRRSASPKSQDDGTSPQHNRKAKSPRSPTPTSNRQSKTNINPGKKNSPRNSARMKPNAKRNQSKTKAKGQGRGKDGRGGRGKGGQGGGGRN